MKKYSLLKADFEETVIAIPPSIHGAKSSNLNLPARSIFVSFMHLCAWWMIVGETELDTTLFYFDINRNWLFPSTAADEHPIATQTPKALRDLILKKDKAGHVFYRYATAVAEMIPANPMCF